MNVTISQIAQQADACFAAFCEQVPLEEGQIAVVGCSTSEVMGEKIGTFSSTEAAEAIMAAIERHLLCKKVYVAVQCCEHLNRALVVEKECALKYNLEIVNVIPAKKAGGALSVCAFDRFDCPVVVEKLSAHAGIDIGDTLIGMHLRPVVVPVRVKSPNIGGANVVMAKTRAKYIGGPRAHYAE